MARGRRGRGRRPRRHYEDEYVEEVYYDDEPEYPVKSIIIGIAILLVVGAVAVYLMTANSPRPYRPSGTQVYNSQAAPAPAQPELKPVQVGTPKINLKAVEDALWKTKTDNPKDFKGWMKKFEDEANAIYFASLKKANPSADPTTLMKKPLRVDPQRKNNLLYIYGYNDKNKQPGYQNGQDDLIFAFQQTQPYNKDSKRLSYSLRDNSGYYYRSPTYSHAVPTSYSPLFLGFFLYPTVWYGAYWRPRFAWWGTPYWRSGIFYNRYNYYYGSAYYGGYYGFYRRTYYTRHRPWGWGRGSYYRRGVGGRYYSRGSRYRSRGYRGSRYRSGSRYRGGSRYRSGSRYRGSGSRYRGSGSRYRGSGSRYRGSGSRYRGSGGSRYRSGGSRYRGGGGKW